MQNMLGGQTVIILGAGPSLGSATALACAEEGANVVMAARKSTQMEELTRQISEMGGNSLAVVTDMTNPEDCKSLVDRAVERFGSVDGIVTVAAMPEDNLLLTECDDDLSNWRPIMDTNFFGTMQVVKPTIDQMLKQEKGGSIVIINSMTSQLPWERLLPYAASKAALAAAARCLALEFGPKKIRVNSLHCGAILNDAFLDNIEHLAERNGSTRDEVHKYIAELAPLGFIATPEDYVGSVLYLLSNQSRPVTGISLHANSGRFMG